MKTSHKPLVMMKACFLIMFLTVYLSGTAFSAPPGRIVSLAPSITEILYDLGLEDRIAAVTIYCDYPPRAKDKPKIGAFSNPSLEAIIAAAPDLVIMADEGNPMEIRSRLKKLGINTYVFRAKRLVDLPQGIRDLGVVLGIRDQAFKRAEKIERQIRKYERNIQKSPPPYFNKKAIFIIQPEPLVVAGPKTVIDDAFKLLGLQNIASDAGSRYPKYSIEELIRRSPDIIFMGKGVMTNESSKSLLKRLGMLDAVKKGHIYYTSEALYRLAPTAIAGIDEIAGFLGGY
ncbi:MAG: ABC transporter substrate-binding protein [Syntrophales bacterium]|jgi:iron complex transport system substrate-binding protein